MRPGAGRCRNLLLKTLYGKLQEMCSPGLFVAGIISLILISGCGQGGEEGITVTISPSSATLELEGQQTFSATVSGAKTDTGVDWSIQEGSEGGSLDSSGNYTAPVIPGTYHVVAASKEDPTRKATVTITVTVGSKWLKYINYFRSLTKYADGTSLGSVTEDSRLSDGAYNHAIYLVKNDTSHPTIDPTGNVHDEDPSKPFYTPEGQAAAQNGDVTKSESPNATNQDAIDSWMTGPFHALWILDPALQTVGYGRYSEADGVGWQMAAVLDVIQGRGNPPAGVQYPLMYPGKDTTTIRLLSYPGQESPDPLAHTSCSGFTTPTGLPIIIQLGADPTASNTPSVTNVSVKKGGTDLTICWFDESSYTNSNSSLQDKARSVMNVHDAVIIIPKNPLEAGATYTVSVTADGSTYTWSFTTSSLAGQ